MPVLRIINVNEFFLHFLAVIVLIVYDTSGFVHADVLYEGSPCTMENGARGVCKKLPECPPRIADVRAGRRTSDGEGRCGFENFTEIVCCPQMISDKIGIRPADMACHEYENEVTSNSGDGLDETGTDDEGLHFNILGGSRAATGEFPYMAALGYENTGSDVKDAIVYKCGGALISSHHVLTAAHCVSSLGNRPPIRVRMGSEDLRSPIGDVQEINVSKIIPHPTYRRSVVYDDIALIELTEPARMSKSVKPICLQTRSFFDANSTGESEFVVIGFGATNFEGTGSDTLMKSANLSLVPNEDCKSNYEGFTKLPRGLRENMICAVDPARVSDACQGDSGGPLIMITDTAHSIVGVTSFGQGCGGPFPGVYTSVYSYLDWIESHVWPMQVKV